MILSMLLGAVGMPTGVVQADAAWTAYNDASGTTGGNTTTYTITTGNTTGLLKNHATGANTTVTATITTYGGLSVQTAGAETAVGTDAYNTFHNNANMAGVINYGSTGWWMDVTFTGLDPAKTYTFATSANRAGGTGGTPAYPTRVSRFTISDATTAINASTSGVTVKTTTFTGDTTAFVTGENTANGYVARWTGIQPGSDGDFTVRAQADGTVNEAYGFSVFMLQEEVTTSSCFTLTLGHTGNGTTPTASPANSTGCSVGQYVAGELINLSGATPDSGWQIASWYGTSNNPVQPAPIR